MREILFRGKRKDNGEWIEGYYCNCVKAVGMETIPSIQQTNDNSLYFREVIPESVGQYTGLTDKNGKKIFEGDIIRYADEGEYRCYLESLECPEDYESVSFNDLWTIDEVVYGINIGYPAFDLNNHEWEINGLSCLNDSGQYFYEVIGNIHDNPELMEKTK